MSGVSAETTKALLTTPGSSRRFIERNIHLLFIKETVEAMSRPSSATRFILVVE
jgi:hypothetical protein